VIRRRWQLNEHRLQLRARSEDNTYTIYIYVYTSYKSAIYTHRYNIQCIYTRIYTVYMDIYLYTQVYRYLFTVYISALEDPVSVSVPQSQVHIQENTEQLLPPGQQTTDRKTLKPQEHTQKHLIRHCTHTLLLLTLYIFSQMFKCLYRFFCIYFINVL